MKTRDVICMKKLGENLFAVVGAENCQGKEPPVKEKPCPDLEPCPSEWFNTKWSQVMGCISFVLTIFLMNKRANILVVWTFGNEF